MGGREEGRDGWREVGRDGKRDKRERDSVCGCVLVCLMAHLKSTRCFTECAALG